MILMNKLNLKRCIYISQKQLNEWLIITLLFLYGPKAFLVLEQKLRA